METVYWKNICKSFFKSQEPMMINQLIKAPDISVTAYKTVCKKKKNSGNTCNIQI